MSDKNLSYKLSLYVDGALSDEDARALEQYLSAHPEAAQELRELQAMKQLLSEKEQLQPDIGFWTRLSIALNKEKDEEQNLLPFPRKFVPAILTLGALSMVAVGVILVQERDLVLGYLTEKSEEVHQVYESNFLKGAITPLLDHLDQDNVLQFALFGTIPLGDDSETALRVDETTEKGYTIELGKPLKDDPNARGSLEPNVAALTVKAFYNEIQPTTQQELMIDSVLRITQQQLVASVFMAEDEALAIDPGLPKLGRMTVSSIAACLEPVQRVRFEKFLQARNAPYTVVQKVFERDTKRRVHEAFVKLHDAPRPEQFVIVTPDTLVLRQLEFNIDSLRRTIPHTGQRTRMDFGRLTKQFSRPKSDQQVTVVGTHPMKVRGGDGFFSIEIGTGTSQELPIDDVSLIVKPRHPRPNVYFFQNQTPFEDNFHMVDSVPYSQERLDSMIQMIRIGKVKSYGPKLDSLMRHIEQGRLNREE